MHRAVQSRIQNLAMNNFSSASLLASTRTYRPKPMARVTVRMYATVREASGTSSSEIEASDLLELLHRLGSNYGSELAHILDSWNTDGEGIVVLINGRNVGPRGLRNTKLVDGDEVAIFPPVSGG